MKKKLELKKKKLKDDANFATAQKESIAKAVGKWKNRDDALMPVVMFISSKGKEVSITKILDPKDYWLNRSRRGESWIVKHLGVEKLAMAAGVKKQINTQFRIDVLPSYENGMSHQVIGTMTCISKGKKSICAHGSDRTFYSTGEASRQNTNARGGSYMRVMAEKRAYDRGVLDHLQLKDKINIYSEDEADSFEQEKMKPIDQIIEKLSGILNEIINAKNMDELNLVASAIKKLTLEQDEIEYLRGVWVRRREEINPSL